MNVKPECMLGSGRLPEKRAVAGAAALVVIGTFTWGCDAQPNKVVHPTEENLAPRGSPVLRASGLPEGLSDARLHQWSLMKAALLGVVSSEVLVSLGREGTMGDTSLDIFGAEVSAAMDPGTGTLFVLDEWNHAVKIFGPDGSPEGGFGRAGPGPGEFRSPGGIERLSDGRLLIVDGPAIEFFASSDTGYVHAGTQVVGRSVYDACVNRGRMWISSWSEESETAIHEVGITDLSRSGSFGRSYRSDHWLVRGDLSDGSVACLENPRRVIFAFAVFPVLESYSVDGERIWTASVEGWLQASITEEHVGGQPTVARYYGASDYIWDMVVLSDDFVLLQAIRFHESGESFQVRSYLVDAQSGQGALVTVELPLVMALGPERIALGWLLPYPRLEVRSVDWNGAGR